MAQNETKGARDEPSVDTRSSSRGLLRSGHAFRSSLPQPYDSASIREPPNQPNEPKPEAKTVIMKMIEKYTLNVDQVRAFEIVARHSTDANADPLRMYIGGPGGTGKSRVIDALKDFLEARDKKRRLRLSSYTGVAARNISGQ
jgi:hypothetical protein